MTACSNGRPGTGPKPPRHLMRRWWRDASGTTAIEFGFVALPFLMMLFGIIGVGLYFFTTFSLENAVEQASRILRTGQAQQANYTAAQFKSKVCSYVPSYVDCTNKVVVNVQNYADPSLITSASLPSCLSAGSTLKTTAAYAPGGASQVVLVWVCYEWDLTKSLPFLKLGNMSGGARLIQATTVFVSEPYS